MTSNQTQHGKQISGPLTSWSDGKAKDTILQFVALVTDVSGPTFVPT